ncbi:Hypothetical predicted protein, partial [Podarcis lilfordi]
DSSCGKDLNTVSKDIHSKEFYCVKLQEVSKGGVNEKKELKNEIAKADTMKCNIKSEKAEQ